MKTKRNQSRTSEQARYAVGEFLFIRCKHRGIASTIWDSQRKIYSDQEGLHRKENRNLSLKRESTCNWWIRKADG